jgi:hypothetical protein
MATSPTPSTDPKLDLLRHTLATVAYRGGKALRGAPASFADFRSGDSTRTPLAIVAHLSDLFDWALSIARGKQVWRDSSAAARNWDEEVARFFAALASFDGFLASGKEPAVPLEKLFQGPIADALNHIGQLALLRRLAGAPIKGENYYMADIAAGRVGPEQAAPRREFD